MPTPYVGEIRMFAGTFAPLSWLFCSGQIVPISNYDALFALLGTTYGGDGQSTFALPDLRGRVPIHQGNGFVPGQIGGVEQVTLTVNQLAAHSHSLFATKDPTTTPNAKDNVLGTPPATTPYFAAPPQTALGAQSLTVFQGGSLPHDNIQPFQCINYIIAYEGIFPQRN